MGRRGKLHLLAMILLTGFLVGTMDLSNAQETQNDANSGADAPDSISTPVIVSPEITYTGKLGDLLVNAEGGTDNKDYYEVTPTATGYINVLFEVTSIDNTSITTVSLLKGGQTVAIESFWNDDPPFKMVVPITDLTPIVLKVNSYSDYVAYQFTISFNQVTYSQSDAGTAGDSSILSPVQVNIGTAYDGTIGNGHVDSSGLIDDEDYFTVNVPAQGYLNVSVNTQTVDSFNDFSVFVETSSFDIIFSDSPGLFSSEVRFDAPIVGAGTYYFHIDSLAWNGTYQFTLEFTAVTLPVQHDAGITGDAASDFASAPSITLNTTITGTVGEGLLDSSTGARDNDDFFRFETTTYGRLNITVQFISSLDSLPTVYVDLKNNSDLFKSSYLSVYASSYSDIKSDSVVLEKGDQYFLDVWTFDYNVTYEIDISFTPIQRSTTTSSQTTSSTSSSMTSSQTTSATSNPTTSTTSHPKTSVSTTSITSSTSSTLSSSETPISSSSEQSTPTTSTEVSFLIQTSLLLLGVSWFFIQRKN